MKANHSERLISFKALIVHNNISHVNAVNESVVTLAKELNCKDINTEVAVSADDACVMLSSDSTIDMVLLDWVMSNDEQNNESAR